MNKNDVIFAIVCGLAVAWIAFDFFVKYGWIFFIILPLLSIIGLWLCDLIGRKIFIVRQAGRFALAGAFADVIDIKVFQLLIIFAPFSLFFKAISFLVAMAIKFWANKHWAFEKPGKDGIKKEAIQFLIVTLIGLALDVFSFYYLSRIKIGISTKLWVELSIIFAALVTAVWNFLGYKFVVFKK
jgi:putative flippase GtrA